MNKFYYVRHERYAIDLPIHDTNKEQLQHVLVYIVAQYRQLIAHQVQKYCSIITLTNMSSSLKVAIPIMSNHIPQFPEKK